MHYYDLKREDYGIEFHIDSPHELNAREASLVCDSFIRDESEKLLGLYLVKYNGPDLSASDLTSLSDSLFRSAHRSGSSVLIQTPRDPHDKTGSGES